MPAKWGYPADIMCGIVAYIGTKPARDLLLEGLKRLEYRGYDSAGMAVINGGVKIAKTKGRVAGLEDTIVHDEGFNGTIGIAHTRWATHGEPSEINAHPHRDDQASGHGIIIGACLSPSPSQSVRASAWGHGRLQLGSNGQQIILKQMDLY